MVVSVPVGAVVVVGFPVVLVSVEGGFVVFPAGALVPFRMFGSIARNGGVDDELLVSIVSFPPIGAMVPVEFSPVVFPIGTDV